MDNSDQDFCQINHQIQVRRLDHLNRDLNRRYEQQNSTLQNFIKRLQERAQQQLGGKCNILQKQFNLIEQYLLDYVIKNIKNFSNYNRNEKTKMPLKFPNINSYESIMITLLQHQILSEIDGSISKIISQHDRISKIAVKVSKSQFQKNYYKTKITGYDIKQNQNQNKKKLEEALISGPTIGILTKFKKFKRKDLYENSAFICYITSNSDSQWDCQATSIQPIYSYKQAVMNFININNITTFVRQCIAIKNLKYFYRYKDFILGNIAQQKSWISHQIENVQKQIIIGKNKIIKNQSQIKAIKQINHAQSGFFLIHGATGTGKTQTTINLAIQQYKKNYSNGGKLMICSQSNSSINSLCKMILSQKLKYSLNIDQKRPQIVRLGHLSHSNAALLPISLSHLAQKLFLSRYCNVQDKKTITELRIQLFSLSERIKKYKYQQKPQNKKEYYILKQSYSKIMGQILQIKGLIKQKNSIYMDIVKSIISQAKIILSTLNSYGKPLYIKYIHDIDCLIVDQACQVIEPSLLIPFQSNPRKVVLLGDHKQLNPTVFSQNAELTKYNRSMFQRLIQNKCSHYRLNIQYNMLPQLCQFFNHKFYGGILKSKQFRIQQLPKINQKMTKFCVFYDISYGIQSQFKKSKMNEAQAQAVILMTEKLLQKDNTLSIGIITHYRSQVQEIQQRIQKYQFYTQHRSQIKISTVDSFQGQSRDIIIISNVRANRQGNVGFIKNQRRMNVALSRGKYGMFVFGHRRTLMECQLWRQYINYHEDLHTMMHIRDEEEFSSALNKNFRRYISKKT